jgi:hypothetical protein
MKMKICQKIYCFENVLSQGTKKTAGNTFAVYNPLIKGKEIERWGATIAKWGSTIAI